MKNFGTIKNNVLVKKVNPSIHKLKILDAYGIDYALYSKLTPEGEVVLITPTGNLWASVSLFERHGIKRSFGAGLQVFLQEKRWLKMVV